MTKMKKFFVNWVISESSLTFQCTSNFKTIRDSLADESRIAECCCCASKGEDDVAVKESIKEIGNLNDVCIFDK